MSPILCLECADQLNQMDFLNFVRFFVIQELITRMSTRSDVVPFSSEEIKRMIAANNVCTEIKFYQNNVTHLIKGTVAFERLIRISRHLCHLEQEIYTY